MLGINFLVELLGDDDVDEERRLRCLNDDNKVMAEYQRAARARSRQRQGTKAVPTLYSSSIWAEQHAYDWDVEAEG
jgi:hypothetical protein